MVMNGRIRLINYKYLLTCIQVKSHSRLLLSRMVIIHAVQKLLNTSRLKPSLFVSQPSEGQELHSWYARLVATGTVGKLLVIYVHEPSLLTIFCRGKTIKAKLPEFEERLKALLKRWDFDDTFITTEMGWVKEGHAISKTNSKSMLACMNAMIPDIEWKCANYGEYENIDLNEMEDRYKTWLTKDVTKPYYLRKTFEYWQDKGVLKTNV